MKKIAVFCALPPGRNTGMATVDLAAFSFIRRIAPEAEVTLYAYGAPSRYAYRAEDLPYDYVNVEEHAERFFASDAFIYWGDFIHAYDYWRNTHDPLQYSRFVFLTDLPDARLKDAIVFGGTIITNEAGQEIDALYYESFVRFFKGARAVHFRDALSAAKISPLRSCAASLGCDPAFLLEDADLRQISGFKPVGECKGVGVFFGRSPSKLRMMRFARSVAKQLGEKHAWLPWFEYPHARRRQRWPLLALGYWIRSGNADTGAILSALSGYRYIITDTYHLCVNAWRMGIPAVCIGQGVGDSATSLGDKKKEILYEMIGARQFYVFLESLRLRNGFCGETKRMTALLEKNEVVMQVEANVTAQREMALVRLADAIRGMV